MTSILSTFTNKELTARLHAAQMNATGVVDCVFKNFDQEFEIVTSGLELIISPGACSIGSRTGQLLEKKVETLPPNTKFRIIAEIALGNGGDFEIIVEHNPKGQFNPLVQNDFQKNPFGRRQMLLWEGASNTASIELTDKRTFDNEIVKKVQMKKITQDNGNPFIICNKDGDVFSELEKYKENGVYSVRISSHAKNAPAPSGVTHFSGFYHVSYSGEQRTILVSATYSETRTLWMNSNNKNTSDGWGGWIRLANTIDLETKANTSVAQMKKVSQDNGRPFWVTTDKTITEVLLKQGMGVISLYVEANVNDAPTVTAGTGIFNIHSANNTTMYGAAYYIVGNKLYYQQINGQVKKENWIMLATEQQITNLKKISFVDLSGKLKYGEPSITNLKNLHDYWKQFPREGFTGYIPSNAEPGIRPQDNQLSIRYIGHKSNDNDTGHTAGIGFAYAAGVQSYQPIPYVSAWAGTEQNKIQWAELGLQKNLSVERTGTPKLIVTSAKSLLSEAERLRLNESTRDGNGVYTFYSNALALDTPYKLGIAGRASLLGTIQIYGNWIIITGQDDYGNTYTNQFNYSRAPKWSGWSCSGKTFHRHWKGKSTITTERTFSIPSGVQSIRIPIPNSPIIELVKDMSQWMCISMFHGSEYKWEISWMDTSKLYIKPVGASNPDLAITFVDISYAR